ncbi:histidinol phosphatase-like enzyme (inositol monophosphatase family) [Litoreibacter ponti]|uniref:Histidinol-phosphatase n=1 Tax=Litoreibacter ponti TaxID=1510457 RepID=A0A2T6BDI2_9RHOB|nr:histidinol-phosphatase [Litoreibacter ponti]PTX54127.1 histidinol phosphatase-like enzyme (inositol monophosphatase family) [Litoreibacter ponti]
MGEIDKTELVALTHRLADAARGETLRYFRSSGLDTSSKEADRFDPVTVADRAAEKAMRDILDRERPQDAILGEEYGTKQGSSGLTWVLDPIDGTRGYISGTPTWGTLVGLHDGTRVILGLIDQPYIGERFLGGLGQASFKGPHSDGPLQVSGCKTLADATIFTTFPEVGTATQAAAFREVAETCRLTRYGMDCYAYALLAAGQIDLVIEAGLAPYDIQGPIGVVEAAGGVVTDWQGAPADQGGTAVAAASPEMHAAVLEILARHV